MAPFIYNSDAVRQALTLPPEERRQMTTSLAIQEGLKGAGFASAVWLPTIAYLHYGSGRASQLFRTRFNTSARTASTIMPIMFTFGMVSEQVSSRLANPGAYERVSSRNKSTLSFPQQLANWIHDHPFRTVVMIGSPGVLAAFISEGGQGLPVSQRLMHTRVIGQFWVVGTLGFTMAFHDWMEKRGRYEEAQPQENTN